MRVKYLEDGLLDGATEFFPHMHHESKLYIVEGQLYKIINAAFRDEEREKTIINLSKFNDNESGIPSSLLYDNRINKNFAGLEMEFYKDFYELKKVFDSLSYKDRLTIAMKLALRIESYERKKYAYNDIHSRNILVRNTDIKIIDMDNGCFSSLVGETEYERINNYSHMHLSQYILCLLFNIEVYPFSGIINKNYELFEKHSNNNQMRVIKSALNLDREHGFHVSDFIESITDDYIQEIKPNLKNHSLMRR